MNITQYCQSKMRGTKLKWAAKLGVIATGFSAISAFAKSSGNPFGTFGISPQDLESTTTQDTGSAMHTVLIVVGALLVISCVGVLMSTLKKAQKNKDDDDHSTPWMIVILVIIVLLIGMTMIGIGLAGATALGS